MNEYRDLNILGVGRETGGRFRKVLVAGAGKFEGSVECDECSVPGSCKIGDGGLTVHGPLSCYGAASAEGAVSAESMAVFGSFHTESDCEVAGDLEVAGSLKTEGACTVRGAANVKGTVKTEGGFRANALQVLGSLKSEAAVQAEQIEVLGTMKTEGSVQAESFRAEGPVSIEGELNADKVELILAGGAEIESIVGGSVRVRRTADSGAAKRRRLNVRVNLSLRFGGQDRTLLVSHGESRLVTELIEADEIDIEYTDAQTVRGVNVHIGNECVVDRVEFSGTLTTEASALIREKVKI